MEYELYSTHMSSQKFLNIEKVKKFSLPCKRSQKVNNIETILSIITRSHIEDITKKTRIGLIIKQSVKAKIVKESLSSSLKSLEQSLEIVENLVVYLSYLLETWEKNVEDIIIIVMATQTEKDLEPDDEDLLRILATKINLTNIIN